VIELLWIVNSKKFGSSDCGLSQGLISEHNWMIGEKFVASRRQYVRCYSYSNREPVKYVSKTAVLFCWIWRIGNGERAVIADKPFREQKNLNLNNQTSSVSLGPIGIWSIDVGLAKKTRHQQWRGSTCLLGQDTKLVAATGQYNSPLYEHFNSKREKQPSFYGAEQAACHKLIIIENSNLLKSHVLFTY
jgi:hypothetical protein